MCRETLHTREAGLSSRVMQTTNDRLESQYSNRCNHDAKDVAAVLVSLPLSFPFSPSSVIASVKFGE